MKHSLILWILCICSTLTGQQNSYWQQHVDYTMHIDFDVKKHRFNGEQTIIYTNNSPDTLKRVYYHLYFNAFQPKSMMDVRSRTISDPDPRVGSRIYDLNSDEIGYQKVQNFTQNGVECHFNTEGTILEVDLNQALLPGQKTRLHMEFKAQVPVQIRRSGRDNAEGISYSMAQWYPKLCEYDYMGWHANPYIGREFHGVWGDFDVTLKIDRKYTVAASGVLQNQEKMGHGYSDRNTKKRALFASKKLTWRFIAEDVHDFFWAADPDYVHIMGVSDEGTELHYFYDPTSANVENWKQLHKVMNAAQSFMNKRYGAYPYPVYSFVQGGDGGMEYPMGTLITGKRSLGSLVGVSIHEWMHSWYQMVLATNESLYPWMDEGFTSFGSSETMNYLKEQKLIPGTAVENPLKNTLQGYARFSQSGYEEALSTHADHYLTNRAYGAGSYVKGSTFLAQLEYIMGAEDFDKALKRYYHEWKFKHPTANDFIRVCEKQCGLELDWYREYMVNTTHTIDYAVDTVYSAGNRKTHIDLRKIGNMPFPQDLTVELKDGQKINYSIALRIMRGHKTDAMFEAQNLLDWPWTHELYSFDIPYDFDHIKSVTLDPLERTSDTDRNNNSWNKE